MMAPMRVAGTRRAMDRALADRPSGFMNSSRRISPGWVLIRIFLSSILVRRADIRPSVMIVDDFDVLCAIVPDEADSILPVDPNAVLAFPVSLQGFQLVEIGRASGRESVCK